MDYILVAMVIVGMWGAFFLGSRKDRERIVEFGGKLHPEPMDYPEEPTDEEYIRLMRGVAENAENIETS